MPIDLTKTWYVSFEMPKKERKASERRHPRLSESFSTELDARKFARQKFEEGYLVTAGTINPCRPRRAISSTDILEWLSEITEHSSIEASSEDAKEPDLS